MPRQSCSTEERARDCLVDFLQCLDRHPLASFLRLLFPAHLPPALANPKALTLESEHPSIGKSRVDLAIKGKNTVLCLEVKVDDDEQIGQYIKYRDYFRHQGYIVHAAGLVNRFKRHGCRNDNEPFFEFLQIPRLLWSEVLAAFSSEFGRTAEFKAFQRALNEAGAVVASQPRADLSAHRNPAKDCALLSRNTWALMEFYRALLARFPGWDAVPVKYGNAPYSLHLGKPEWAQLFNEFSCRRIVLGFNNGRKGQLHSEPYFAPCIMLWDRTWFTNKQWFLDHRVSIAEHFRRLGFQVIRNQGAHRNTDWLPPFQDVSSLYFANAFWEDHFSLPESEYCREGWGKSLDRLETEIRKLAKMIDSLRS